LQSKTGENAMGRQIAWLHDVVRGIDIAIGEINAGASDLQVVRLLWRKNMKSK
jgi:hypothetical protein